MSGSASMMSACHVWEVRGAYCNALDGAGPRRLLVAQGPRPPGQGGGQTLVGGRPLRCSNSFFHFWSLRKPASTYFSLSDRMCSIWPRSSGEQA